MSSATSTSSGCIIEHVMPSSSCCRIARSTASYAYPSDTGPIAMLKSMNSLPSTSQTCEPLPRCKYFGATPATYCEGPLASVCVQAGMRPLARAYHSSDRTITGRRSTWAISGINTPSCVVVRCERGGNAPRELIGRKALALEHVGEQRRSEPAAVQRDRVQSNGDMIRRRHLGHDRREPAGGEMVLDRDDQRRLARGRENRRLVGWLQRPHVHEPRRDASVLQALDGLVAFVRQTSVGEQRHVGALGDDLRPSRRKRYPMAEGWFTRVVAHVPRRAIADDTRHGVEHFGLVCRATDVHPGDSAHESDILERLVGRPVGLRQESGQRADQLDRKLSDADVSPDEF